MAEFKTLIERTLQLDYGRFLEVAIKQGDKSAFLRIAGGELYLDGKQSMGKRYNKGWVSIPINRPEYSEQVADLMREVVTEYYDGSKASSDLEREKAGKPIESLVEAKQPKSKGKGKGK